jgi:hypothetical protein
MAIQKPAGLDEAIKPLKALTFAWDLARNPLLPDGGISDKSLLRNALPLPLGPTVGDIRTLVRVLESYYGEFPL